MKKVLVWLIAAAAMAPMAPIGAAAAEVGVDINGFVKVLGYVSDFATPFAGYLNPSADPPTSSYGEERTHLRFTAGNENVRGVAHFEFDQVWGDSAYTNGRNVGGGLQADTNNLETKNLYVWFRLPAAGFDATVGVQSQPDSYAGTFLAADMAGIFANVRRGPGNLRLGYGKFWENDIARSDDVTFYLVEGELTPSPEARVGLNFYFLEDQSGKLGPTTPPNRVDVDGTPYPVGGLGGRGGVLPFVPAELAGHHGLRLYQPGVDFSLTVGTLTLSGFGYYQFGEAEQDDGSVDLGGYAADLRADAPLGPGKAFFEGLYVSGDGDPEDRSYESIVTGANYNHSAAYYVRTDMYILLPNADLVSGFGLAYDVANGSAGFAHLAAGYRQNLTENLTGKVGAGWSQATALRHRDVVPANFANSKSMGTELNASLNYRIYKGLEVGVAAAYAFLGSAYDASAENPVAGDPDDLWVVVTRLCYTF